jgi:hypothetical protein
MSFKRLAVLGVLVGTLTIAASISATTASAGNVPRMGDQGVGLLACANGVPGACDDLTLTAGEAFHVAHGFATEPWPDLVNPLHRFELTIDGTQVHGAIDLDKATLEKWYVFNFPQGMTGTHTFTGCWYSTDGSLAFPCGTRIVHFV